MESQEAGGGGAKEGLVLTAQEAGLVEAAAFTLHLLGEVHGLLAHSTLLSSSPVRHPAAEAQAEAASGLGMPAGPIVTAPSSICCLHWSCQPGAAEIPLSWELWGFTTPFCARKGRKGDSDGRLQALGDPGHRHLGRSQSCYYPSPGPRVTNPWCCRVSRLSPWLETQLLLPQHPFHFCHHRAGVESGLPKGQELTPDATKPNGSWHHVPHTPSHCLPPALGHLQILQDRRKSAAPGTRAQVQGKHLSTNLSHHAAPWHNINASVSLPSFLKCI